MTEIFVPIAPGELIDKLTILRLKADNIDDPEKLANVRREKALLETVADRSIPASAELTALWAELYEINKSLWQVEDDIRACEARGEFGDTFVSLARQVYVTNDDRAQVKKKINVLLGSAIVEEKSYHSTDPV